MGVVYHGDYFHYFEVARTEFLREYGIRYRDMEESGMYLVVVESGARFRKGIRYDEMMTISARVSERSGVRIGFDYEIRPEETDPEEPPHVTGRTVLACVDGDGRPRRFPAPLKDAIDQMMDSGG